MTFSPHVWQKVFCCSNHNGTAAFKAQRSITLKNTTHPRTLNSNLMCSQRATLPFVQAVTSHIILRQYIRKTQTATNNPLFPRKHTRPLGPNHQHRYKTHPCRVISGSLPTEETRRPHLLRSCRPLPPALLSATISSFISHYRTMRLPVSVALTAGRTTWKQWGISVAGQLRRVIKRVYAEGC